jgi:hypothetical protein
MAGGLRVVELQVVPELTRLVIGQRNDLGHVHAFDVRCAEDVPNGEFVLREESLERELANVPDHGVSFITPQAIRPPEFPAGSV